MSEYIRLAGVLYKRIDVEHRQKECGCGYVDGIHVIVCPQHNSVAVPSALTALDTQCFTGPREEN